MKKKEKTLTFRTKQFTIICNHNARSGNCIIKKGSKVYNVTGKMPIKVGSCVAYIGYEEIDLNHLVQKQNIFAVLVRAEAEMKRIIKKRKKGSL